MKKAVVFLANGFEEVEALTPVDYLRRSGVEVITVATGTSSRTVEGARKIPVIADMTLETYVSSTAELPDAVIVPGGMPGTVNVSNCSQLAVPLRGKALFTNWSIFSKRFFLDASFRLVASSSKNLWNLSITSVVIVA